jgi:hypothetical protein
MLYARIMSNFSSSAKVLHLTSYICKCMYSALWVILALHPVLDRSLKVSVRRRLAAFPLT